MKKNRLHFNDLTAALAFASLLSLGTFAGAQSLHAQNSTPVQDNDATRQGNSTPTQNDGATTQGSSSPAQDNDATRQDYNTTSQNNGNTRKDNDANRDDRTRFEQFMDSHREIAEQLRKDPSLINNKDFVNNHPPLRAFLQQQPGIRDEARRDPDAFMRQDNNFNNFDRRNDDRNRVGNPAQLARFDQFLDSHREIAEQLRKDPSLIDNREFVDNHPALKTYLQDQPAIRAEITQNPNAFMREENNFDHRTDARDRDFDHGQMASFHEFLNGHSKISQDVSKNPSLASNHEYVENHPELRDYLRTHPDVQQSLNKNPHDFVKSSQQFDTTRTAPPPVKAPAIDAKPKQ